MVLNYVVPPEILAARVPEGTELDDEAGRHYASVVAFRFRNTRVRGVPIPGHRHFEEVNLRFYVRRRASDGETRRGVVFVKEIVPRRAIAWLARRLYNENYVALPMRHEDTLGGATSGPARGRIAYAWRGKPGWDTASATVQGAPTLPADAGHEAFILEHYWGYARQRGGGTVEYRVAHPRWRVWPALEARLDADLLRLYGPEFAVLLAGPPHSAFVAEGSAVAVFPGRRLPAPPI